MKEAILKFIAPPTLSASYVPILVGFVCVYFIGDVSFSLWHLPWMLMALLGITCVETGKHALNELTDFHSGCDLFVDKDHITPVSAGKKVLPNGVATEKQVWGIALVCFFLAVVIGLIIVINLSFPVLWFGIFGIFLAVIYNAEPFKVIYRGFGEVCIFLAYGPVCLLGAYVMFCQSHFLLPFLLSCSIGFLITNVLVINEFPDYEADVKAGKMNFIARIGKEKGVFYVGLLYACHFIPLLFVAILTKNPIWLLSLLTIFPMVKALKNAKANKNDIAKLIKSNLTVISVHKYAAIIMIIVIITTALIRG